MQVTYRLIDGILHLLWDKYPEAHHYRVMAMSHTFAYISIFSTTKLNYDIDISKENPYISLKIVAESADNHILCESNEINVFGASVEKFKMAVLDGYHGMTLSFRSKIIYDLYRIYNKNVLIAETEDPIVELPYKIKKDQIGDIMVEGYKKDDNKYLLCGILDGIVQIPQRDNSNYKISVVVPVYNSQMFLPRTVDSILSSSMPNLEVILVDDGSTDKSLDICNWYAEQFPCVSVVHQSNQGVCVARNTGISSAKGEYVGLVDNDDIVHPLMYEKLYNACKIENVDIAIAATLIRNDINDKKFCLDLPGKDENILLYTYEELIKSIGTCDNIYFVAVRNKIVKLDIAKKVKFPIDYPNNIVLYEDDAYTPTLYSYIDKFAMCRDAYYIWDKRKQKTIGTASTMHKKESSEDVWKSYIYACSYPFYYRCEKYKDLSNYASFKHIIEKYDKFTESSPLFDYRNEKLKSIINRERLMENKYIMENEHLSDVVKKLM